MGVERLRFRRNPNIGLYGFSNEKSCFLGRVLKKTMRDKISEALGTPVISGTMMGTSLAGIFSAGNSKGIIVSDKLFENEIKALEKQTSVLTLKTSFTALGNLILCNDHGCIISEEIKKHSGKISDFLGVPVKTGTIAGMDLVGSLALATNKGCLAYKMIETSEAKAIGKVLKVGVDVGSVNFGNYWVRSGIIANSRGAVVGEQTSGPELGIIAETLGFV